MNRATKVLKLGNGKVRHQTILSTDDCQPGTPEFRYHQFDLFRTLADNPNLSACGMQDFQTGDFYHDGRRWIAEFNADVEETAKAG